MCKLHTSLEKGLLRSQKFTSSHNIHDIIMMAGRALVYLPDFATKWLSQNFIKMLFIKVISCMVEWKMSFLFGHWLALASCVLLLPNIRWPCSLVVRLCSPECVPNTFAESGFNKKLFSTPNTSTNTQKSYLIFWTKVKLLIYTV